jgi:hypothetical protein
VLIGHLNGPKNRFAIVIRYVGPKDAFENEGNRDHGVCRSQQLDRWSR